nr:unnamed protein product [Digitaria exilis]
MIVWLVERRGVTVEQRYRTERPWAVVAQRLMVSSKAAGMGFTRQIWEAVSSDSSGPDGVQSMNPYGPDGIQSIGDNQHTMEMSTEVTMKSPGPDEVQSIGQERLANEQFSSDVTMISPGPDKMLPIGKKRLAEEVSSYDTMISLGPDEVQSIGEKRIAIELSSDVTMVSPGSGGKHFGSDGVVNSAETQCALEVVSSDASMLNNSPSWSNKDRGKHDDIGIESEDAENLRNLLTQIEMEENAEGGLESVDMKVSRHNKPKKVHVKVICAQDYACDEQDKQIIKSIGGLGDDRTVVRVGDAFVTMHNFKCLLERSEYLNGDGDMEKFRLKLAAILLESDNNTAIESEDTESNADETIDPNDCVILETPQSFQCTYTSFRDTAEAICDYILSIADGDALGEPKCHFLDLKFFWDCNYRRHPLHRVKPEPKKLATYFDVWPNSGVTFSECQLLFDGVLSFRTHEQLGWSTIPSFASCG